MLPRLWEPQWVTKWFGHVLEGGLSYRRQGVVSSGAGTRRRRRLLASLVEEGPERLVHLPQ